MSQRNAKSILDKLNEVSKEYADINTGLLKVKDLQSVVKEIEKKFNLKIFPEYAYKQFNEMIDRADKKDVMLNTEDLKKVIIPANVLSSMMKSGYKMEDVDDRNNIKAHVLMDSGDHTIVKSSALSNSSRNASSDVGTTRATSGYTNLIHQRTMEINECIRSSALVLAAHISSNLELCERKNVSIFRDGILNALDTPTDNGAVVSLRTYLDLVKILLDLHSRAEKIVKLSLIRPNDEMFRFKMENAILSGEPRTLSDIPQRSRLSITPSKLYTSATSATTSATTVATAAVAAVAAVKVEPRSAHNREPAHLTLAITVLVSLIYFFVERNSFYFFSNFIIYPYDFEKAF